MGTSVEIGECGAATGMGLQLLGPMKAWHGSEPIALPASRKVRVLIAYLALAARPVTRAHLCELLWEQPNDPRGELRWCLSKARGVLDEPGCVRLVAEDESLRLEMSTLRVDSAQLQEALQLGIARCDATRLRQLAALFRGDFVEGLKLERCPAFSAWLVAQRRRLRDAHVAVLEHLVQALAPESDEAVELLSRWLQLAPYDRRAHEHMVQALALRCQWREGEQQLQAAVRLFEAEGQDAASIVHAWRQAREASRPVQVGPAERAEPVPPSTLSALPAETPWAVGRRASIAVMPFVDATLAGAAPPAGWGASLAHDVTTRLAKLRSMFVIAPSSAAALSARGLGAEEAARALDVDYVAGGTVQRLGGRMRVQVQLSEARTARILWADVLDGALPDTLALLDALGDRMVGAIASQIELAERNRAILKPPNLLDAWEAHHRGLWHMYRFNPQDNVQARRFFETAIGLDPSFARPYAGLSFTHWQNAFLGWGARGQEAELAYRTAVQGALADDQDPTTRWALGRAHWLRGDIAGSLAELEVAVDLSPNFSPGHYTLAFVQSQSGDAQAAIRASDHARELSPFDPLLFAMLATRALALMRLERYDEAANWALKAIARPNAHVHTLGIAAHCLALAERHDEALRVAATLRERVPGYGLSDFLAAFRLADDGVALVRRVAPQLGLA